MYFIVIDFLKNVIGEIVFMLFVGIGFFGDEELFDGEETFVREFVRGDSVCDVMELMSVCCLG